MTYHPDPPGHPAPPPSAPPPWPYRVHVPMTDRLIVWCDSSVCHEDKRGCETWVNDECRCMVEPL